MKTKRLLIALALALVTIGNCAAAGPIEVSPSPIPASLAAGPGIAPQAEETVWYTRIGPDGKGQKRLWSITKGIWLTDWIDIDP